VPNLAVYAASKAALARWSGLVSIDVLETTARFISLHPGAVKIAMGAKSRLEVRSQIQISNLRPTSLCR
jgi:short-subunit dehydrogenase